MGASAIGYTLSTRNITTSLVYLSMPLFFVKRSAPESIELFIEDQASDHRSPPFPLSRQHIVSLPQSSCVSPVAY
jgi:hypothetical protein